MKRVFLIFRISILGMLLSAVTLYAQSNDYYTINLNTVVKSCPNALLYRLDLSYGGRAIFSS